MTNREITLIAAGALIAAAAQLMTHAYYMWNARKMGTDEGSIVPWEYALHLIAWPLTAVWIAATTLIGYALGGDDDEAA